MLVEPLKTRSNAAFPPPRASLHLGPVPSMTPTSIKSRPVLKKNNAFSGTWTFKRTKIFESPSP